MLARALTHVMNAMVFPAALAGASLPGRGEEGLGLGRSCLVR